MSATPTEQRRYPRFELSCPIDLLPENWSKLSESLFRL
jgi:hypothetical protein